MDEIEIGANRSRSVWVQEGVFGVQPSLSLCQFSLVPFFFFSPLDRDKDERQSMDFDLSSSMEPSSRRDRAVDRVLIYLNNL